MLLKNGASAISTDIKGLVVYEALLSDRAGSSHILTNILCTNPPENIQEILSAKNEELSRYSKYYWLKIGLKNSYPQEKLNLFKVPRLNELKFKIVGQSFALN
jgi:hypothetical protein